MGTNQTRRGSHTQGPVRLRLSCDKHEPVAPRIQHLGKYGKTSVLREPRVNAKVVLASSELPDEGARIAGGTFLSKPGSYRVGGLKLEGFAAPHDRVGGRRFGQATIWSPHLQHQRINNRFPVPKRLLTLHKRSEAKDSVSNPELTDLQPIILEKPRYSS